MERICANCDYLSHPQGEVGICWGWKAEGEEVVPAEIEVSLTGTCPQWKPARMKFKKEGRAE